MSAAIQAAYDQLTKEHREVIDLLIVLLQAGG